MFMNDQQSSRACSALLQRIPRLRDLWTDQGPTDDACEYLRQDGGTLSSGERVMLLAAFAFWNSHKALPFADIFDLDPAHRIALAGLIAAEAAGSTAVEQWLAKQNA